MKLLANILTDKKFSDEGIYNVVSSKENLIEGIPTLVIGWGFTKTNYPEANILNWEIDDMTYWTFGMREKNQRYQENIKNFKKLIFTKLIKLVKYEYINLLTIDKSIENLIAVLTYVNEFNVYIYDNMLYVMSKGTNKVYGYSLRDLEYIDGNKNEIISALHSNKSIKIIDNKEDIPLDIKIYLKNKQYIIPYLF